MRRLLGEIPGNATSSPPFHLDRSCLLTGASRRVLTTFDAVLTLPLSCVVALEMSATLALASAAAGPTPAPLGSSPETERIATALVEWASAMRSGGYEPGFPNVLAKLDAANTTALLSPASTTSPPVGLRESGQDRSTTLTAQ